MEKEKNFCKKLFTMLIVLLLAIDTVAVISCANTTSDNRGVLAVNGGKDVAQDDSESGASDDIVEDEVLATVVYDETTKTLTISGPGKIDSSLLTADMKNNCEKIVIEEGVTTIGNSAFMSCRKLTSVTIPNTVKTIGDIAFWYCHELTTIHIPSSVTSIASLAMSALDKLESITVDSENPNYFSHEGLLYDKKEKKLFECPNAKAGVVNIPEGIISLGSQLGSVKGITTVNIPSTVTITSSDFHYASGLTAINVDNAHPSFSSENGILYNKNKTEVIKCPEGKTGTVSLPNTLTTIGNFSNCTKLTSITIPNSVTAIDNNAFYNTRFTSITIPNSVKSIGSHAFYSDTLTSITIPSSVTSIEPAAFYSCKNLSTINVDSGNQNFSFYDGVLYNKNKTEIIQCLDIKTGAFTIPDSVTSIGNSAFYNSKITSVTIPSSVTSIGDSAFFISNLATISYKGTKDSWNNINFGNMWKHGARVTSVNCSDGTFSFVSGGDTLQ